MNAEEKRAFRKELLGLALPLALQNLLHALVGASDALMLGRLTQDAIAAVSLANQVSFVMSLFSGAVIGAVGVLIAQYWGKRDYLAARRFLAMALRYCCAVSFVFFALAFFLPEQIMRVLTPESELIRIGAGYLRIVSFSYLFTGVSQCFLMMMKISGHVRMSVAISAVTVAVDMLVDLFLIYGIGPVPALGANGSAYSTIAVECIALIWCVLWSKGKPEARLRGGELRFFSRAYELDIWRIIPGMLASGLLWGLSITMQSFILGHMGTDATAAASVTTVAHQLTECLAQGLASGAGILLGQLLGSNQLNKARAFGDQCWSVSFWCGLANAVIVGVLGVVVYRFYVLEPIAKGYLVKMLIFRAAYLFALSYNAMFTCGVFPAGGDAKYDAISVFFATWCFALPLALLGCFVFHWPVMVVYVVMCIDEIVKVPFISLRYRKELWLRNLTRDEA